MSGNAQQSESQLACDCGPDVRFCWRTACAVSLPIFDFRLATSSERWRSACGVEPAVWRNRLARKPANHAAFRRSGEYLGRLLAPDVGGCLRSLSPAARYISHLLGQWMGARMVRSLHILRYISHLLGRSLDWLLAVTLESAESKDE